MDHDIVSHHERKEQQIQALQEMITQALAQIPTPIGGSIFIDNITFNINIANGGGATINHGHMEVKD